MTIHGKSKIENTPIAHHLQVLPVSAFTDRVSDGGECFTATFLQLHTGVSVSWLSQG